MENIKFGEYSAESSTTMETCVLSPPPVGRGECSYYENRFKNFFLRHPTCRHQPPVYYYGHLRETKEKGKLSDYEKTLIRTKAALRMRLSVIGDVNGNIEIEEAEKRRLKADNLLAVYNRGGKKVIASPHASYGYKYCIRFSNELSPKLTAGGKVWLRSAKLDLQRYMESGVVDKYYISNYNKKYNIVNKLTMNDGKTLTDKTGRTVTKFYENIELFNSKFQSFAFATHPDAYNPKKMSYLPAHDLFRILFTPDMKEWMGAETWNQAWIMAKNMNYKNVTGATWDQLKKDTKEGLEKAKDKLESYWDEIFN